MTTIIHVGDALEVLRTMPAESVHCVVTSPPYWGLRDYGTASWDGGDPDCDHRKPPNGSDPAKGSTLGGGKKTTGHSQESWGDFCRKCGARRVDKQIGLEPTPQEFLSKMVAVFDEVRRVLRSDGVCWLNLGSSYASGDTSPIQSRRALRAPAYGSDGTAPQDCSAFGHACPDCGGGLQAGYWTRRGGTAGILQPTEQSPQPSEPTVHGSERSDSTGVKPSLLAAPSSTTSASTSRDPGAACLGGGSSPDLGADPTSCGDALSNGRTASSSPGTSSTGLTWVADRLGTALVCSACGYSTMRHRMFKPKDLISQPWMVADALQQNGWYLRSDCIWAKPNPMPESVTDRPTKAHEYVFLLTKSARYFYDADAVREEGEGYGRSVWTNMVFKSGDITRHHGAKGSVTPTFEGGRNLRTVWTIPTQPYAGAHFATFPEEIPRRCIRAGCPEGGTVLDPFLGSGTTGQVAVEEGRNFVGIELNPEYAKLARRRIDAVAPLFRQSKVNT